MLISLCANCKRTGIVHQEIRDFVKMTLTRVKSRYHCQKVFNKCALRLCRGVWHSENWRTGF